VKSSEHYQNILSKNLKPIKKVETETWLAKMLKFLLVYLIII